jgi:hypothetical protein
MANGIASRPNPTIGTGLRYASPLFPQGALTPNEGSSLALNGLLTFSEGTGSNAKSAIGSVPCRNARRPSGIKLG